MNISLSKFLNNVNRHCFFLLQRHLRHIDKITRYTYKIKYINKHLRIGNIDFSNKNNYNQKE